MNLQIFPLVWTAYAQFPYSRLSAPKFTYEWSVTSTSSAGGAYVDVKWGTALVRNYSVIPPGTVSFETGGGAGSPGIRGKSNAPVGQILTFNCTSC